MRSLLLGIALIIVIGVGGLIYRNAVEHPSQPIACPLDAEVCPDGTSVSRVGSSCTFPACPPPNVALAGAGIAYAIPAGFAAVALPDAPSIAAYEEPAAASSTGAANIVIRQYAIAASSTALDTIEATAIGGASGAPVPVTAFSSTILGTHRFTVVSIEQFEGTIDTAYYLGTRHRCPALRRYRPGRGGLDRPRLQSFGAPRRAGLAGSPFEPARRLRIVLCWGHTLNFCSL